MKRKGISLIVLIITIVVIIILATAIIVNLAGTNIIGNANEAVVKQDFKTMQDELTMYIADEFVNTDGKFKAEDLDVTVKSEIENILPSIKGTKYADYVVIEDGKIAIVDTMPEPEKTWAMEALGLIDTTANAPTLDTVAPTVPTALELTVVENNITATASGSTDDNSFTYEYSIDGVTWQSSGEFKDLESVTEYTVYARAKDNAGNVSSKIEKSITTKYNIVAVNETVVGGNGILTGEMPSYNNPVIPVGFKAIETTEALWTESNSTVSGWNNGLVIQDSEENEYVWVPVDGTNIKYEKWDNSISNQYSVTLEQTSDCELPNGITSETEQITKYGGFYVARYEASLPDEQTTQTLMATKTFSAEDNNRTDIGKAQSKMGKIIWDRISRTNAKIVSESVISNKYVQSGLITGTQWDTMMRFISKDIENNTNIGNYKDKYGYTINGYYKTKREDIVYSKGDYTKSSAAYLILETGKYGELFETAILKNLYDVAGNAWEWTAETVIKQGGTSTAVGTAVARSGSGHTNVEDYDYRNGVVDANSTSSGTTFRFVLYIK